MRGVVDFLRGSVRVELRCRYSERAVNICARHHVEFWDLRRTEDGAAEMTVTLGGYMTLRRVAEDSGAFTVKIVRRRGVPFFLWRIRKRYALVAGLLACLTLIGLSSVYVWQIDVTGNEAVSSAEILAALREQGVEIGTCVLDIRFREVINDMLLRVPELSFITLNNHGSRLEVIVREKIPKPELYDPEVPTAVYAGKAGVISELTVREGWATAALGDTVAAGDELISAYVPVGAGRLTHAAGSVYARTWYTLTMQMPLEGGRKVYTGEKTAKTAVIFGGKRINFYFTGGNPYPTCDKITEYRRMTLPGGAVLPVTWVRERYEEYRLVPGSLTEAEAERILSAALLHRLEGEIGDGSVLSSEFTTESREGLVTVTLRAECLEQIARERALTEGEIDALRAAP